MTTPPNTVEAWNDLLSQFLNELVTVLPGDPKIVEFRDAHSMMRIKNGRQCVELFVKSVTPYASKIMKRDPSLFSCSTTFETDAFLNQINVCKYWTRELTENTRSAIWQYLQLLYMLGSTLIVMPQESLSALEQCAARAQQNPEEMTKLMGTIVNQIVPTLQQHRDGGEQDKNDSTEVLGPMMNILPGLIETFRNGGGPR